SYPEVDRTTPRNNPLLGNPRVVLSQLDTQIRISSNPTPIIGIDLASNTAPDTQPALKSVVVQVVNTSGFTPVSDLSAMTIFGDTSGIGLWYDLNKNGVFDGAPGDTPLTLVSPPTKTITEGAEVYDRYLMVLRDPLLLDGVGSDSKIFVTLKTSATISAADALSLRIQGSEIKPGSSYGLGFRAKDAIAADTAVEANTYMVVALPTSDTITLDTPVLNAALDYTNNWYLIVTAGSAVGQVYRVVGVVGQVVTVATLDPAGLSVDLTGGGTITAVKFFKVESTSYKSISAPVVCFGSTNLRISQPSLPGELPTPFPARTYLIQYDADAAPGTLLALYRVSPSTYADTALIVNTGLTLGFGQTYLWDTSAVPTGTYRIVGELGPVGSGNKKLSLGTVVITNSPPGNPGAGALGIDASPITIGNVVQVTLSGLTDADSDILRVTFYTIDQTGGDTRYLWDSLANPFIIPASSYGVDALDVDSGWTTTGTTAGTRRLYATIYDGINTKVVVGPQTRLFQTAGGGGGLGSGGVISMANIAQDGQGILPWSGPTGVLRITGTGPDNPTTPDPLFVPQFFTGATVVFRDGNANDDATWEDSDLRDVRIFLDEGLPDGYFQSNDTELAATVSGSNGVYTITLNSPVRLLSVAKNFFIVVRTSGTISGNLTIDGETGGDYRDKFNVEAIVVNALGIAINAFSSTITCESRIIDLVPWRSDKRDTNQYRGQVMDYLEYQVGDLAGYREDFQDHGRVKAEPELMPMNTPYRVLGLDVSGTSGFTYDREEYLNKLVVTFEDTGIPDNFDPNTALASHGLALWPNVSLWQDTGDGIFDPAVDTLLSTTGKGATGQDHVDIDLVVPGKWRATMNFSKLLVDPIVDGLVDFFVVISSTPDHGFVDASPYYGADFKVYVEPSTFEGEFVKFAFATPEIAIDASQLTRKIDQVKEVHAVFSLTPLNDGVAEADGLPVSLFALNLCDGPGTFGSNETLESIRVWFKGTGGFKPSRLSPMSDDDLSGVSLWRDDKELGRYVDYLGLPDPRAGTERLGDTTNRATPGLNSYLDTLIPLSADSFEWYNSDGSPWGPFNDDPANLLDDDKRYFIVLKPKVAVQLYPEDYIENTTTYSDQYMGDDFFICVRGRGVDDASYSTNNWWDRGMDYGVVISAAIGLTNSNDGGRVAVGINNDKPWGDIHFGADGASPRSRVFPNGTDPVEISASTTLPTFFTDLTQAGQTINPHQKTAVIGINLVAPPGAAVSFNHFAFNLQDLGSAANFNFPELVAANGDWNDPNGGCGAAIYKDNKLAGTPGIFDPADTRVLMTARPFLDNLINNPGTWNRIRLPLDATSVGFVPTNDVGVNAGPDYFLVLQPNSNMESGDDFRIRLWGSGWPREQTLSFLGDASGITFKRKITSLLTNRTVSVTTLNSPIVLGQGTDATSDPTAAIGINVYDTAGINTFNQTRVYFNPVLGSPSTNPNIILAPLDATSTSGLSIWRDNNANGIFDWRSDTFLPSVSGGWQLDSVGGFVTGPPGPRTSFPDSARHGAQLFQFRRQGFLV
ncbi:MAG: hypothetical protein NTY10_06805, partial [Candidatus Omnitrophica bacterium]|nr:hypothetical protein [Candidatus Omnitrophota bacterium]